MEKTQQPVLHAKWGQAVERDRATRQGTLSASRRNLAGGLRSARSPDTQSLLNQPDKHHIVKETLSTITPSEMEALHAEHGHGLTPSLLAQTRAPLGSLHLAPLVFQPRNPKDKWWMKAHHVVELTRRSTPKSGIGWSG